LSITTACQSQVFAGARHTHYFFSSSYCHIWRTQANIKSFDPITGPRLTRYPWQVPLVSTFHLELTITSNPSAVLHVQPYPHHQPTIHRLPLTILGPRLLASRPVLRPFLTLCNRTCVCASASITTATTTTLAKVVKLGLLLE
ncbi:hypothetical protein CNYM01_03191, partial [Colletotrichum nymphaeae SA-01]